MRSIIHPGFGHSATTSLQRQLFSRRPDLFYCGNPYGVLGGIFSWIKFQDSHEFVADAVRRLCETHIFSKLQPRQRIVVSDESFIEQTEVYFTPIMMPLSMIAERLHALFPDALVLFTIRNQYDCVVSMYLNLKRNFAKLNQRPIEDFDRWFAGQTSQVHNLYLRNLNYAKAIAVYASRFGRESVFVLPLELIKHEGSAAYLQRLGRYLAMPMADEDEGAFTTIVNQRLTTLEDDVASLSSNSQFWGFFTKLEERVGSEALKRHLRNAPPVEIKLSKDQVAYITKSAREGNAWIENEFGLPLRDYGYPA
jgi:hypothetical protein